MGNNRGSAICGGLRRSHDPVRSLLRQGVASMIPYLDGLCCRPAFRRRYPRLPACEGFVGARRLSRRVVGYAYPLSGNTYKARQVRDNLIGEHASQVVPDLGIVSISLGDPRSGSLNPFQTVNATRCSRYDPIYGAQFLRAGLEASCSASSLRMSVCEIRHRPRNFMRFE